MVKVDTSKVIQMMELLLVFGQEVSLIADDD